MPRGAIAATADRKSWITSIDGKRDNITFSLGSRHIVRGHGLSKTVSGWIMSSRLIPKRGAGASTRYQKTGSVLNIDVRSDDEIAVTVTQIKSGEITWSSSNNYTSELYMLLRVAGGGQQIQMRLAKSLYKCAPGEPNCD